MRPSPYPRFNLLAWPILLVLIACQSTTPSHPVSPGGSPDQPSIPSSSPLVETTDLEITASPEVMLPTDFKLAYTYQRGDGNRLIAGKGALPDITPVDIPLGGPPLWIVAASSAQATLWSVILEDGRHQVFRLEQGVIDELTPEPASLPAGMPPLLMIENGNMALVTAEGLPVTQLSHSLLLSDRSLAAIDPDGNLNILSPQGQQIAGFALQALPDARILVDGQDNLLVLSGATDRYPHGVLGDDLEASSLTWIKLSPQPRVLKSVATLDPMVIEGIAPIWVDLTGDGVREVIVTVSDAAFGARLAVLDNEGAVIASGPEIGSGFRWVHQIAVAPFGPEGQLELGAILTPHLGGVAQFYRLDRMHLEVATELPGYTSHLLGSRNLDLAAAGDFDGDGRVELLLPNQALTELAAIQHQVDGAVVLWSVPTGGRPSTNLAGVSLDDGSLEVGLGRADGVLRIWPSNSSP